MDDDTDIKIASQNQIDEAELSSLVAGKILADLEANVDRQLENCDRYTLACSISPEIGECEKQSEARFFHYIGLLKDVSILGRKLLELAPQLNALKLKSRPSSPTSSCVNQNTEKDSLRLKPDDDTTSEDLLAMLIESSSSDDFLVLSSSLESITIRDMVLAALIYIRVHDCFTLSHDIQGVVMVLRRVKFMILNILAPRDQMELITKLLTSIGRYNEMNYVFDLFRDRNQFELLLSKGVERTPELRTALFHYVKKNPEFFPLVTLNFSMFTEIAESLEESALEKLNRATQKNSSSVSKNRFYRNNRDKDSSDSLATSVSIDANIHIRKQVSKSSAEPKHKYSEEHLELVLAELIDASDCYAKAGCYKRSESCEKKAKLVALQIAHIPTGVDVLNLEQTGSIDRVSDLIVSFDRFDHAFIVAEAYEYHLGWRQALFNNVVVAANPTYLDDYCKKWDLSTAFVEELVLLYKQNISLSSSDPNQRAKLAEGMKMLLARLPDVETRCRILSQLNFDEAKEQIIRRNPAVMAHLKDLKLA